MYRFQTGFENLKCNSVVLFKVVTLDNSETYTLSKDGLLRFSDVVTIIKRSMPASRVFTGNTNTKYVLSLLKIIPFM